MNNAQRVLLVDDDPLVLAGFREILTREGYDIAAVFSGREAIEKLETDDFDVVLTDLLMPRVSGLDVLRSARERRPDCVVIVVTGYASVRSAVEALRLGAHDYIIKPCDEQELLFRVKMGVERVHLHRELRAKELDAEKMKAIAQTAVTVNDQINTPLNVILNSAEYIRLKAETPSAEVQQSLDFIGQEVNKIKTVIQKLAHIADPKIKEYSGGAIYMVDVEASGQKPGTLHALAADDRTRILVVDDEVFMVQTLTRILEAMGYDVMPAYGGKEAQQIFNSQTVDLIITDLHMPDMSGLELLTCIKSQNPAMPVILVTGFGVDNARESASRWKADGFLGKPFQISELKRLIEKTLASLPSSITRDHEANAAPVN
jgi:DNA-binding NtrC family response regulator